MTEIAVAAKHKSGRSTPANTIPVRVAYPFFHTKKTKRANGAPVKTPHYAGTLLFPKTNADATKCANYAWLASHCMEAAKAAWPGNVDAAGNWTWPQGGFWPIQDGDQSYVAKPPQPGQAAAPPKEYPWRKGHWVIEVTHYLDPGPKIAVLQANGQAYDIPAKNINGRQVYKSGDVWMMHLSAFSFHNEKFGCNFGFEGALWVAEGELIGNDSGPKASSAMFAGVANFVAPSPGVPSLPVPGAAPAMPGNPAYAPQMPAAPVQTYAAPGPAYQAPTPGYAPPNPTQGAPAYVPTPGAPVMTAPQPMAAVAYPSSVPPMPPAGAPIYQAPQPAGVYQTPGPGAAPLPPFPR